MTDKDKLNLISNIIHAAWEIIEMNDTAWEAITIALDKVVMYDGRAEE